ncbi:MAG TPA: tRNA lysidine(34) synthetase TilS [Solirubrobacteraceae bacterium]
MTPEQVVAGPDHVLRSIAAEGLLARGRPIVVMLSGGRDSVCLLDLAVRIAGPAAVTALHLNYGLRDGSDEDQRYCELLCKRLGVALSLRQAPAPARGNLQAWARELRYCAAAELARGTRADIAAGHTATDQVETILYRLASSPSRRALLGMRSREPVPGEPQAWLVRPLLTLTRTETATYCRARELAFREDETNEQNRFARSRVRNGLVPALRAVHPAAEENVLALAELLRAEAEVLEELVADVLAGATEVPLARLRLLHPALARLVVQQLADAAAGGPAPGAARRLEELLSLPEDGRAALDLPHGVRAIAERGALRFVRR